MIQYNDYELLYLMNEFDEEAEKIFYNKYLAMIRANVFKMNISKRNIDDFIQEGLYMLMVATRTYDMSSEKTFNKYFELILKRRLSRLCIQENAYSHNVELLEDEGLLCEPDMFVYKYDDEDNNLSSFEKEVLTLKKQKYKPKDISKVLKCDVKSVYNCLCRIKDKIKR